MTGTRCLAAGISLWGLAVLAGCGSASLEPAPPVSESRQPLAPSPEGLARLPHPTTIPTIDGRAERTLALDAGQYVPVRTRQTLSTRECRSGDAFEATLLQDLTAYGHIVARRGSRVDGQVVGSDPGRQGSSSRLSLRLTALRGAKGESLPLTTEELPALPAGSAPDAVLPGEITLGFRLSAPLHFTVIETR